MNDNLPVRILVKLDGTGTWKFVRPDLYPEIPPGYREVTGSEMRAALDEDG